MPLTTKIAAFAAIMAAAPGVYAASTGNLPPPTRLAPELNNIIQPDEMRASKVLGSPVYDVQNRYFASVKDLVFSKAGNVNAVILDLGGGRYVALPISDIKTDNNRLTLYTNKEQIEMMAPYKLENPDTGAGTSPSPPRGGRLGR